MSVKIKYFVHGTTTDNEKSLSSGWNDVDLSQLGYEQSQKLKNLTLKDNFDAVFCSDLQRAVKTANIAFGDRFTVIEDSRLRECNYGDFNGKPSSIVEPMQEELITKRFPNGESYEDVRERIKSFLDDLRQNYDDKTIGIVAHKAPQLALDVLIKDKSWKDAFAEDWRKQKAWQPGWEYILV